MSSNGIRFKTPEFGFPQPIKWNVICSRQTHDKIQIMPRLADRSVVIKPVDPIYTPAGQRGTLYISTPLWIAGFVEGLQRTLV